MDFMWMMVFIAAIVMLCLLGAIATIMHYWHRVRIKQVEASLKQQMLEKGMSAAEIEQVLRSSKEAPGPPAGSGAEARQALIILGVLLGLCLVFFGVFFAFRLLP